MTSSSIYLLIFFAAFLHALWNIIIKSIKNSLVGIAMKVFFQSIIFFPIIFFVPLPVGITWLFIICSLILHSLYFILLGSMYNRSDLTFIYPIARGCAPFFVTILSLILFSLLNKHKQWKPTPLKKNSTQYMSHFYQHSSLQHHQKMYKLK